MRKITITILLSIAVLGFAQNKMNITLKGGAVNTYNTTEVQKVDINGKNITVYPTNGESIYYTGSVSGIAFVKNKSDHVIINEAGGWFESAYVKWASYAGASAYHIYIKGEEESEYHQLDNELVRNYGSYGRADMPGLKAGTYQMKVVPVVNGHEQEAAASVTSDLEVRAHDRSGFAHFNYSNGVGAYNNDGTLKEGAKVIYITANTAKTVTTQVKTGDKASNITTYTGIQSILDGYMKGYDNTPICFRLIGKVSLSDLDHISSSAEGLQIKNNKSGPMNITIEGIGDDATIHGFGILLHGAESVEIRNLGVMWFMDDGISIDTENLHCWVHHVDFFYGQKGSDKDQVKGDGSLDVKSNSQYCTFSYNHFWDSGKCSLCGMKSESGPNFMTYHHNWFDHSDSRHPRVRTMSVHVYNNYFDGNSKYGVGATTGADIFVENNYFRDCKYPILTSMQGSDIAGGGDGTFSSEDGGSIKAYGNIMKGVYTYRPYSNTNKTEFDAYETDSREGRVPADVTAKKGGDTYSNWDTDASLMYSYTPDDAAQVPAIVKGIYGAGRINHGDFRPIFNNNIQDNEDNLLTNLSSAIQSYDSFLVGFYEGDTTIGKGGVGFSTTGGDTTEGDELPFGDYNKAEGGADNPPVTTGDAFMASADGNDYFFFNSDNAEQVNSWIANGVITMDSDSKFNPTFTHADYPKYTGSIQLAKSTGYVIFKCPSVSTFRLQMMRTGSYAGNVYISNDGQTYSKVSEISGSKGNKELDISSSVASNNEVYVKIENTSTGSMHIHAAYIIAAKQ